MKNTKHKMQVQNMINIRNATYKCKRQIQYTKYINTIQYEHTNYNIQNTQYEMQHTKNIMQNSKYNILNANYKIQRTTYKIQYTNYNMQNTACVI